MHHTFNQIDMHRALACRSSATHVIIAGFTFSSSIIDSFRGFKAKRQRRCPACTILVVRANLHTPQPNTHLHGHPAKQNVEIHIRRIFLSALHALFSGMRVKQGRWTNGRSPTTIFRNSTLAHARGKLLKCWLIILSVSPNYPNSLSAPRHATTHLIKSQLNCTLLCPLRCCTLGSKHRAV